jgi:hypothetical protein
MKLILMARIPVILSFMSFAAKAAPVFTDVAEELGLSSLQGKAKLYPDSNQPNVHYLFPSEFVGHTSPLQNDLVLWRRPLAGGSTEYSFLLQPKANLFETIYILNDFANLLGKKPDFLVEPLKCLEASVSLDGVPPKAFTASQVFSITTSITIPFDGTYDLPAGYIYLARFETNDANAFERTLLRLGANGSASVSCEGFSRTESGILQPFHVRTSIPITARFTSVEDVSE